MEVHGLQFLSIHIGPLGGGVLVGKVRRIGSRANVRTRQNA